MSKTFQPIDIAKIGEPQERAVTPIVSLPSLPLEPPSQIVPLGIREAVTKACELMPAVIGAYQDALRATHYFNGADTGLPDHAARHRAAQAIRELAYGKTPLIAIYNAAESDVSLNRRIRLEDVSDAELQAREAVRMLKRQRERMAREEVKRKVEAIDMITSQVIETDKH